MILTINLQSNRDFIIAIFKRPTKLFSSLVKLIKKIKQTSTTQSLYQNINNFFLEEYKTIYFKSPSDAELEQIYIREQSRLSDKFSVSVEKFDAKTYKKLLDTLFEFNISYDNFFENKKDEIINEDDKPAYKLCVAQSVIRCAFSKEKGRYYPNNSMPSFFEYYFIERVIYKDMVETKEMFGDFYTTLFRKEDLCDDIIKYIFFIFGNDMFINVIEMPLQKISLHPISMANKDELPIEVFESFFKEMIAKLYDYIPQVLRIVLKIVYNKANEVFTIQKDNFAPLFSVLVFNYFISPRVQDIYRIDFNGNQIIKRINRLLRVRHDPFIYIFKYNTL